MNDFVFISYRINDKTDIEADVIVNDEACSFVELITVNGGTDTIDTGISQLMQNPKAIGVMVLHGESLQRIVNTFLEG